MTAINHAPSIESNANIVSAVAYYVVKQSISQSAFINVMCSSQLHNKMSLQSYSYGKTS